MSETSPSTVTAAASSAPPVDKSSAGTVTGSSGPTNSDPNASRDTDKTPKSAAPDNDDDFEEEIDGEKVKRKEMRERFKRSKEFERESHKRLREAADHRKAVAAENAQYEEAFKKLDQDPYALYRAKGMTEEQIDDIAQQRLVQRMKRAQMTPEQVDAEETKNRLQQLEAELNQRRETDKKSKQETLQKKYVDHFDGLIAQALEAGNLARTASTGAKVAQVMSEYMAAGEQIDPVVAAQIVRDNHHADIRHEFTQLRDQLKGNRITHEKFLTYVADMIGPETVKAIQNQSIKQAQDFEPQKARSQSRDLTPPKQTFSSFEEANAWIDKQLRKQQNG